MLAGDKMKTIIFIFTVTLALYGISYANDNIPSVTTKLPVKNSLVTRELHLQLSPEPHLIFGNKNIFLKDISSFVNENNQDKIKWTLYFPDAIPIDTAILLFQQFSITKCENVAVYAEDANGEWSKREIGIAVGPNDPVRIITESITDYPQPLQKYTGESYPKNLFVAKCTLTEIEKILPSLLEVSKKKHVCFQESGGIKGMPAARYVDVLKVIKELGVSVVSFYGVYIE